MLNTEALLFFRSSSIEMLDGQDKFSCDKCNSLQEAQVRCGRGLFLWA